MEWRREGGKDREEESVRGGNGDEQGKETDKERGEWRRERENGIRKRRVREEEMEMNGGKRWGRSLTMRVEEGRKQ